MPDWVRKPYWVASFFHQTSKLFSFLTTERGMLGVRQKPWVRLYLSDSYGSGCSPRMLSAGETACGGGRVNVIAFSWSWTQGCFPASKREASILPPQCAAIAALAVFPRLANNFLHCGSACVQLRCLYHYLSLKKKKRKQKTCWDLQIWAPIFLNRVRKVIFRTVLWLIWSLCYLWG